MHNNKFFRKLLQILRKIISVLPMFFWLLIIYGFDSPCFAGLTIISAIIHECGHIFWLFLTDTKAPDLRGVLSGFRIKQKLYTSYTYDILLFAFGPMANFLTAILCMPLYSNDYILFFMIINIVTALSNLLPVNGYDGFGILQTLIKMTKREYILLPILNTISMIITTFITLLALYILARVGNSFWTAGLFLFSMVNEAARSLDNFFVDFKSFEE